MISKYSIRSYVALVFFAGVVSLFSFLIIPRDPNNSFLLGYSIQRLALIAGNMFTLLGLGFFYWKILKDDNLFQRISLNIGEFLDWDGHRTSGLFLFSAGFVGSFYVLILTFITTDPFLDVILVRLAPLFFLFALTFLGGILFLVFNDLAAARAHIKKQGLAILILLVLLCTGFGMHNYLWALPSEAWDPAGRFISSGNYNLESEDIYYVYLEGGRLEEGENPYARALELPDLTENNKNATYLPGFYYLSWASHVVGLDNFSHFLGFWRIIFLAFNLGIAYLLFYIPYYQYNSLSFGTFAALFWVFNRWVLNVTMIYHIEFLPIFFFLLSLSAWPKHRVFSLLSFGLSLTIKQFALFMFPVYLIWIWQSLEDRSLKKLIGLSLVMISIPLIASAPFIAWNAEGFFKSILISATRNAASHFKIPSLDVLIGLSGIPARLPMLGLIFGVYLLAWKDKIYKFTAALLMMSIIVDFNSVLFSQYMAWVVPLIPLAACSWMRPLTAGSLKKTQDLTSQSNINLQ